MIYNLKLISNISFMSNDFSRFSQEKYFNNKNTSIRIDRYIK